MIDIEKLLNDNAISESTKRLLKLIPESELQRYRNRDPKEYLGDLVRDAFMYVEDDNNPDSLDVLHTALSELCCDELYYPIVAEDFRSRAPESVLNNKLFIAMLSLSTRELWAVCIMLDSMGGQLINGESYAPCTLLAEDDDVITRGEYLHDLFETLTSRTEESFQLLHSWMKDFFTQIYEESCNYDPESWGNIPYIPESRFISIYDKLCGVLDLPERGAAMDDRRRILLEIDNLEKYLNEKRKDFEYIYRKDIKRLEYLKWRLESES